jgi:gamma-glutamyltranspeptidase/glutathione hydrolase
MNQFVVCPEPLAAEAGAEILRAGGSAVDAAIATAFSQAVVSPAMTSLAGTGVMNIFHAPSGRHVLLDFLGHAGSNATPDMYVTRPDDQQTGYRAIAIPMFVRGTHTAFTLFGSGRVSWAQVVAPAIRHAEDGFAVYPYMHQYWRATNPVQQTRAPFDGYRMLTTTPACAQIFTTGDRVHAIGERIVQRDLAATLRRIADDGAEGFYGGEIGRQMARDLADHGAAVTAQDLAECRVEVREPTRGVYRGLTITTDGFPNVGCFLILVLNVLEDDDLAALGVDSPDYFEFMGRALHIASAERAAFAQRRAWSEDEANRLVSKAYARELRARAVESQTVLDPGSSAGGTTQVSTYDHEGSAVSFTHSIGTGSGVVTPGLGFMYNNQMQAYDPVPGRPNSVAPRKSPITGGGATIVLQDNRVRYVIGSPHGFRKVSSMGHVLVSLIDFGLTASAAVTSARIHCEGNPRELIEDMFFPLPFQVRRSLEGRGYHIRPHLYGGRVCFVDVDVRCGRVTAASDPRGGGGLAEA